MASTLCPACGVRVEHPSDYVVVVVQTATPEGTRTRLIANDAIVIHACTTKPVRDGPPEIEDAARDESEIPADETDEG